MAYKKGPTCKYKKNCRRLFLKTFFKRWQVWFQGWLWDVLLSISPLWTDFVYLIINIFLGIYRKMFACHLVMCLSIKPTGHVFKISYRENVLIVNLVKLILTCAVLKKSIIHELLGFYEDWIEKHWPRNDDCMLYLFMSFFPCSLCYRKGRGKGRSLYGDDWKKIILYQCLPNYS